MAPEGEEPLGAGIEEPEDSNGAFPRLTDDQRAQFRAAGKLRPVAAGEVLFQAGDAGYDFFVVESGAVAIVQGYGHENRVVAIHGPHRFLGETNLLTGSPPYLSAVVRDAGEVIQVSVAALRDLVAHDQELSNIVLRAFMARRAILIDLGAGVRVIGSRYSSDARRVREFLARNRMPYQWLDVEEDAEAETLLQSLGVDPEETPVVIGGRGVLRNPANAEVADLLGLGSRGAPPAMCDLVIVGAGPAGLAAALYGASRGWTPRSSTPSRSAARPARRPGSRTILASRPASPAASWPSGRRSRPAGSERGWSSRPRRSRSLRRTATTRSRWRTDRSSTAGR